MTIKSWDRIVELARRWLNQMTPLEKATMHEAQRLEKATMYEEQRLSFAYGQAKFRNPTLTRGDMQRIADQMDGIVRSDT